MTLQKTNNFVKQTTHQKQKVENNSVLNYDKSIIDLSDLDSLKKTIGPYINKLKPQIIKILNDKEINPSDHRAYGKFKRLKDLLDITVCDTERSLNLRFELKETLLIDTLDLSYEEKKICDIANAIIRVSLTPLRARIYEAGDCEDQYEAHNPEIITTNNLNELVIELNRLNFKISLAKENSNRSYLLKMLEKLNHLSTPIPDFSDDIHSLNSTFSVSEYTDTIHIDFIRYCLNDMIADVEEALNIITKKEKKELDIFYNKSKKETRSLLLKIIKIFKYTTGVFEATYNMEPGIKGFNIVMVNRDEAIRLIEERFEQNIYLFSIKLDDFLYSIKKVLIRPHRCLKSQRSVNNQEILNGIAGDFTELNKSLKQVNQEDTQEILNSIKKDLEKFQYQDDGYLELFREFTEIIQQGINRLSR